MAKQKTFGLKRNGLAYWIHRGPDGIPRRDQVFIVRQMRGGEPRFLVRDGFRNTDFEVPGKDLRITLDEANRKCYFLCMESLKALVAVMENL